MKVLMNRISPIVAGFLRVTLSVYVLCLCANAPELAELDVYEGTAGPVSDKYTVILQQNTTTVSPHVYMVDGNKYDHQRDRTVSWVDFAQKELNTVKVTITRTGGNTFPANTEIRPSRYGITLQRINGYQSIQFDVTGNKKWISVHYGGEDPRDDAPNNSSKKDAMLVFINDMPEPVPADVDIEYLPGVNNLLDNRQGRGILTTDRVNYTIYLHRGAYIYGKIKAGYNSMKVLGNGILSGEKFNWVDRLEVPEDHTHMIEPEGWTVQRCEIVGPTIVNASSFYIVTTGNWTIDQVKIIGWDWNNDGMQIRNGTIISDCFVKTGDDSIRMMEGNVQVRRCVVWQHNNGGSVISGWKWGRGAQKNMTVEHCDIIATEWRPDSRLSNNNSAIGLWRHGSDHTISQATYNDIRIDGDCQKPLNLALNDLATGMIEDVTINNLQVFGEVDVVRLSAPNEDQFINSVILKDFKVMHNGQLTMVTDQNKDTMINEFIIEGNVSNITFEHCV
jgi:hypothetical protein